MRLIGEVRDRPLKVRGQVLRGPEADAARRHAANQASLMAGEPIYYIGIDLGSLIDYTAIAIIERMSPKLLGLVHLGRLKGPYPEQVLIIRSLLNRPPLDRTPSVLVVDSTGAGLPVVDLMREEDLNPVGLTITASGDHKWDWREKNATVSKLDLVSQLQIQLQNGRLKLAEGLDLADLLINEMQDFQVKISDNTGRATFSARSGAHDDLVLAAALATWAATRAPKKPKPRPLVLWAPGRDGLRSRPTRIL